MESVSSVLFLSGTTYLSLTKGNKLRNQSVSFSVRYNILIESLTKGNKSFSFSLKSVKQLICL